MFKAMFDQVIKDAIKKEMDDKIKNGGCFGKPTTTHQEPITNPVIPGCFPNLEFPSFKPKI